MHNKRKARILIQAAGAGLLLLPAVGCQHAEKAGRGARGIIGSVEPTGMVAETEARTQTWEAIKKRLDELDIQGFNDAVSALQGMTELARQQLEGIPQENLASLTEETIASLGVLRKQLEDADVAATARSLQGLTEQARRKVAELPTAEARSLVQEVTQLTAELRATVEQLDARLQNTVRHSEDLARQASEVAQAISPDAVRRVVDEVNDATADVRAAIEPIGRAGARWPQTTQQLDATLQAAELVGKVAIGALVLWGLCAVAWLFRLVRPRPAPS